MARASASAVFPWKYHVFLSFRGEDTRRGFTDHLYKQLEARGIRTFRDEPELESGTDINPELLKAIDQSRSAIIVLSTNFASSSWCLRELTHIVRCMKEKKRIFPIFYGVDPSDVRHQRGSFGEAFAEHEVNYREHMEEVNEWRKSLKRVANLAGWNSKDCRYETELIQGIVNTLWEEAHPTLSMLDSSERFVGIDSKMKEIDLLLETDANDVRFIGIWGMGGVGKTTLARLVYERISHDFEGSSFLANVREVCSKDGIVHLQKQLLSEILGENNIQIWNAYSGITKISRCLCNKKVLLVLDDVDQLDQLEKLVIQKEWFGFGSRVVVTTRDERLLVEHGIDMVYEVKPLTQDEALFLFSRKAFKDDELEEDFLELSKCFINYASGLPLALKTLGSFLYKRGRDEWKSALDKLKQAPDRKIFETLKISYDGLDEFEKRIFLDIACFHKSCEKERVIEGLENCGFAGARVVIEVLIEKSLLYISYVCISFNSLSMHDLIQEMAWEIVRQESYDEPGGRSRLWLRKDILHVLTKNTGSEAIEGIVLRLSKFEEAHWNPEAFTKMCKLRLLDIHNVSLSKGPEHLPNALRVLKWSWYPSKCLPPIFQPDELTELSLRHSKIDHLWDGIKRLGKLKSIDLSYSHNLTRTPDFTSIQNLEKLVLEGCTNLAKIHPSIAFLRRLRILNLKDCKSIMSLPNKVEMESLEVFDISGCSKVKKIPEFVGEMKNFRRLSLSRTVVQEIPSSVIRSSLEEIDLSGTALRETESSLVSVKNLVLSNFMGSNAPPARSWRSFFTFGEFPAKISHPASVVLASLRDLCFLKDLNLENCNFCGGAIPKDIGLLSSLVRLNLSGNHLVSLPASISGLSKLQYLNLENCSLCEGAIPEDIGFLSSLETLDLSGNHLVSLPASISGLSKLQYLNLKNCSLCEGAIPEDIGFLSSLERLNLSRNHLVSLPASISGLSQLEGLYLENCSLCEGAILEDIGFLSSLETLDLSGNHFVSLPASFSGLSNLRNFFLSNCKRLQQLPAIADDRRFRRYWCSLENCFSLGGNQSCNAIMYSMLKRFNQELPWSWDIVIPGSEIPEWLNNQSMGDSVIEKQPSHSSNSKAVGFAFCVLFVGSQNISAPNRGVKWSRHYRHEITCLINFGSNTTFQDTPECPLRCITEEVASDHLWLSFLSMNCIGRHSKGKCWDQIRFRCKSETGLKVKKCGVCRLYEQKKSSTER
ncbi:disease resistance protein RUN1-like isoform X2 [Malus sylvestris]|uniref:disease resistance protein RUN1-like isoform X2 n=1 Tax=Malus sylvestris TaxID=3752 RepID=UPI0021ACE0E2|nr:disease resistance protein RUN1-like isoform X2 [Malus sylvestris]